MNDIEKRAHDLAIAVISKVNPLRYESNSFDESCERICSDYNKAYQYFMSHSENMTEKH